MLAFKVEHVDFSPAKGDNQLIKREVTFDGIVRNAYTALVRFDVKFTNGDHHIGELRVCSYVLTQEGNKVWISADILLRDCSGNIDDPFGGWMDVLVIADLQ